VDDQGESLTVYDVSVVPQTKPQANPAYDTQDECADKGPASPASGLKVSDDLFE
jgi:hypothetical protein